MAASEYEARLSGCLNGAAACLALSITRESGLLKVFMEPHQPMTIPQIASRTNLKERYIKELLGCLVTSSIIEVDEASVKYFVPDELRSTLGGKLEHLELLDYASARKEDVKACLATGGPNGFIAQTKPGYAELQKKFRCTDMDIVIQEEFFNHTPDIERKLERGINVLEIGCGLGSIIIELASRYPNSRFIACDYSAKVISNVAKTIKQKGLKNIKAKKVDLHHLPNKWAGRFDVAYIRYTLHDLGQPIRTAIEIVKELKDGGVMLVVELFLKGDNHRENKEDPHAPLHFMLSASVCVPESLCQKGGIGLGSTSGMKSLKNVIYQSGIPVYNIRAYELGAVPNSCKFVCRK
ncbi:S-adenosylmethionine-dependent methyltransferase Rv2258c [Patella vulgata]|uniref:S-adenosylmethionine-dependent methyltransferase Rv2258c n=1 Tax=Patella vulgata TaxID=6465 RepID=UPI00217FE9F7|nr:S-adenosylmethionine-dependent methyltransferase Rv2258c [Patella vulgata]